MCLLIKVNIIAQDAILTNYTVTNGLAQNNITRLAFDENNNLWIGTNGGLNMYNGQTFFTITHKNLSPRIIHIFNNNHCINIIDEYYSIFEGSQKFNKISHIEYRGNLKNIMNNNNNNIDYTRALNPPSLANIKSIYKDEVFFHYKDKIELFNQENVLFNTNKLIILENDCMATAIKAQGLSYHLKSKLPKLIKENGLIFSTNDRTFWLASNNIHEIIINEDSIYAKVLIRNIPLDKKENGLTCGVLDVKSGYFFIGSQSEGLYKIKSNFFQSITSNVIIHNGHKIKPIYYNQLELSERKILVNNSIIISNNQTITLPKIDEIGVRSFSYLDKNNNLWYPGKNSIYVTKKNVKKTINLPNALNYISYCEVNDSTMLLCNPNSIIRIQNYEIKETYSKKQLSLNDNEHINYIYINNQDKALYLLTSEHIFIFDLIKNLSNKIKSIPLSNYRIMAEISDGLIFIGTYGQGYIIYDGKKWTSMPLDKNGYLKFAHTALLDDNDYVWISTNNGLFRTRLKDMIDYTQGKIKDVFYYYYDKSSGFLTDEFNGGCQSPAIKLRDGRFSFSSMDGLVQFDPLKVPALFPTNPIQMIHLSLNGQPQDSIPPHLEISQDIKDIKLEVSTAYYGHPDNLVIQYKIPGYVEAWTDITDQRYITLQNATHGSFNIEIRKRHGFGNDDFNYISYPVTVLPYFYQTWWFISIVFSTGLLLVYLFSSWYNRYTIQKNKELEALIAEKNAGLIQINKTLTEKIKQNDLFQSILVHDIKSPLRFIVSSADLLIKYWPTIGDSIKTENITHIHESASKINSFVEETLLWIQIRDGEYQSQTTSIIIKEILLENVKLYHEDPKIQAGHITVNVDCPSLLHVHADPLFISTIVRNLLDNSIKYSDRGTITLYADQDSKGKICIGCKDEGKGIPDRVIKELLSDDYKGNSIRKDSFRMGYVIIKEIVKLLDGELHIDANSDKRTHVWIDFSS